jgi:murein DD-endopeptidase MepM/ murein hydrolase activator NlpD
MSLYHRLSHLKSSPIVKKGEWVKRGQQIGLVGTSGASSGPHLHYDIFNTLSLGFTFYVYRWSLSKIKSTFSNPAPYIKQGVPSDWSIPMTGYKFCQFVQDRKNGNYYHPGIDVNGVNDYGKPVYSPVEGRVLYVQAPTDKIWSKLFGWLPWGKGWGNMVVIEQAPNFKL